MTDATETTQPVDATVTPQPAAATTDNATEVAALQAVAVTLNPAQTAAVEAILPNFDKFHDDKTFKFHFKKDALGNKRPTVELTLPVPSVEGIASILTKENNKAELDLLREAIEEVIFNQARTIVNENKDISNATFPKESVLWAFIANMEKAERRGGGISQEVWDAFKDDYIAAMPALTGKTIEQVTKAALLLSAKLVNVKTNKPVIQVLKAQLAIYANGAAKAEEYQEVIEFLDTKADKLLAVDDSALLDNL